MELEKKLAEMKQLAALPGHLGLQAAHLGRDGPGLLLQPLITSSASPSWPAPCYTSGREGLKNTSVRFSKRQSPEPPLNIIIF